MPNTVMPEWADMVFLKFNGATFSATTYPKLALVIPSLTLTEARGEFPRIWDDGRGVDTGRALLSAQSDVFKSHSHYFTEVWGATGTDGTAGPYIVAADVGGSRITMNTISTNAPGGDETRPRNIAFNFLVRAK
ncbi:phage tail protein, partial [Enterobacteriaceae bacterium RIT814]|nr:phage tail protein [Enterobacteriaceae bacterium RIT 814]